MKKALRWLDKNAEESLMMFLLSAMVVLMSLQIFMRYVLAASLPWPEELIRYLFIWFVFLGISYGIREGIHLRVDLIEIGIPKLKPFLNVLQNAAFLAFCLYMIRPGFTAIRSLVRSGQTSAAMDLPMYLVYLSLFTGLLLGALRMAQKFAIAIAGAFSAAQKDTEADQ